MIVRVDIDNLVLVAHASFEPGAGMTAVTGETGAGKTLLATAIGLLFGGDAERGQVGPGADHAWIEGEFDPDATFWEQPQVEALASLRPEPDAPLVLARRIDASGRSRALAWGRTVAKSDLAAAGRLLLVTAGQHVQVRLRSPEVQRSTLDGAGGARHAGLLDAMRSAWRDAVAAHQQVERLQLEVDAGGERLDALRDDLALIDLVEPTQQEETQLLAARDQSRHHAAIVASLASAARALGADGADGASAVDRAGEAWSELDAAASLDASLADVASLVRDAQELLSDAATQVSSRLGDISDGPLAIDDIEERLAAYDELKRRFGGTVESVIATRQRASEQLEQSDSSGSRLVAAREIADQTQAAAAAAAAQLSDARASLAEQLQQRACDCLAELGMGGSVFRVQVEPAELAVHGGDRVQLLLAPSERMEPRPVAQVASGGELSRIALALLVATIGEGSTGDSSIGTILFDEIDAGIGGHTSHALATMLRRLADHRQIICITHLPQVAARADSNVVIERTHDSDGGSSTSLRSLPDEAAVLDELTRMLGADSTDAAARTHAQQLRGPRFFDRAQTTIDA